MILYQWLDCSFTIFNHCQWGRPHGSSYSILIISDHTSYSLSLSLKEICLAARRTLEYFKTGGDAVASLPSLPKASSFHSKFLQLQTTPCFALLAKADHNMSFMEESRNPCCREVQDVPALEP